MKAQILLAGIFLFISVNVCAQLKYEGAVSSMYKTFQLDDGTIKYVKYNKKEQKVFVFNLDKTLWREVNLPLPEGHQLDEIKHISVHTFNKDDLMEMAYSCVKYKIPDSDDVREDERSPMEFTLNIINETGDSLLEVLGSHDMKIVHSNGQKNLLVFKLIGKHFDENRETLVYSLPSGK
ncbi:hypothetical protein [Sunxiuqinia dokdonensis]|uniref:Uncharacterized protein n=1 Tax=Sunxiuqinia dokdonensis TaxID=1409788 RepID=A0A0L8V8Y3_9BACT|nr:hypothetical protein [Sunxiuqinia dokdonensis]KOH44813.1 hypothetical protein NC99_23600 [Sunxiuqinia dokdonensis]